VILPAENQQTVEAANEKRRELYPDLLRGKITVSIRCLLGRHDPAIYTLRARDGMRPVRYVACARCDVPMGTVNDWEKARQRARLDGAR